MKISISDIRIGLSGEGKSNVTYVEPNVIVLGNSCFSGKCSSYFGVFPPGVYVFECWGASGTNISNGYSLGGYSKGTIALYHRTKLFFFAGEQGVYSGPKTFNGGGNGNIYGYSGGGGTDVRLIGGSFNSFNSLKSRIIVAGGGGGYVSYSKFNTNFPGKSNGGGFIGESGGIQNLSDVNVIITEAKGGSQTQGGTGGYCPSEFSSGKYENSAERNGSFGIGGSTIYGSSGGGGGYFGGGAGKTNGRQVGLGAGGSSYISGYSECKSIHQSSTNTSIQMLNSSKHYSGLSFSFPEMSNGINLGPGYVTITLLSPLRPWCTFHRSAIPNMFLLYCHLFLSK